MSVSGSDSYSMSVDLDRIYFDNISSPTVVYNNGLLYPEPEGSLLNFLTDILKKRCLFNGMAEYLSIVRNQYVSDIEVSVQFALERLKGMCNGQNCCHDMWWLAGGAAAFMAGKSGSFSDVDLFVNCSGSLDIMHCDRFVTKKGEVVTMSGPCRRPVQIIPVRFQLRMDPEYIRSDINKVAVMDCMAAYVCSTFDLPCTRVAIQFNESFQYRYIDFSSFNAVRFPTSLCRMAKYAQRIISADKHVPNLRQYVVFQMISHYVHGLKLILTDEELDITERD